jgi:hypothetical protein
MIQESENNECGYWDYDLHDKSLRFLHQYIAESGVKHHNHKPNH